MGDANTGLVLWNVAEGRPEQVPAERVHDLLGSGAYLQGPPEVVQGPGGQSTVGSKDVAAAQALGQSPTSAVADLGVEAREAHRRAYVDNAHDKALTFADGLVDALSLGLIHDTSARADLSRAVNSGYALAGQLTGFATGMAVAGPVSAVSELGEKAGFKAAKAVLGDVAAGSRAEIAAKAVGGATEMSALMAAGSAGHQFTDSLLTDKEFSGAAVVHEAEMGALLGGAFKFLSGTFSRAASRYDVKAGTGMLSPDSPAAKEISDHLSNVRTSLDSALEAHDQRLGVLKVLDAEGGLPNNVPEFMQQRVEAVRAARAAQDKLIGREFAGVADENPKAWAEWHQAVEDYQEKVHALDDVMRPKNLEMISPSEPEMGPRDGTEAPGAHVPTEQGQLKLGRRAPGDIDPVLHMENQMSWDPELQAKYEKLHGRKWEPLTEEARNAAGVGIEPDAVASDPHEANLGGEQSPTSELNTPIRKKSPAKLAEEAGPEGETRVAQTSSAPEVAAHDVPGADWKTITPTSVPPEAALAAKFRVFGEPTPIWEKAFGAGQADADQTGRAFASFQEKATGEATPVMNRGAAESATPVISEHAPLTRPSQIEALDRSGSATPAIDKGGQELALRAKAEPPPIPGRARLEASIKSSQAAEGPRAVQDYIDKWYSEARHIRTLSPGDHAAGEIRRILSDVTGKNPGAQSAGDTELGKMLKLPAPRSQLGAVLNDLYVQRRLAEVVADASGNTAMKGAGRNKVVDWLAKRAGGKVGAGIGGAAIGGAVGGPMGYFLGAALVSKYAGFTGRVAGAAGRMYEKSLKAADTLLKGGRSTVAARVVAGNRPYQYSDAGPIKDPVARIAELRRVAANPAAMAALISKQAGDLNVVAPALVSAIASDVVHKIQFLLNYAPPIKQDAFGKDQPPSSNAMRRFYEAENAVHDLDGLLASIANNSVSQIQADALHNAHGKVHAKIAAFLMKDPDKLATLNRAKLRTVEMVLGVPLTPASSDPLFHLRQQASWAPMPQQQLQGNTAQALKIPGAGPPPSEATSNQSINGRAPGN